MQKGRDNMLRATEVIETGGRAIRGLGAIEESLRQARIELEQIDCIAVGLGPGSYTGIRAAIALAQGWQLAREVKLVGVSSAEAIVAQAQADGLQGLVHVVVDAQRNELYWAVYQMDRTTRRQVAPLRLATVADVRASQGSGIIVGPEVTTRFPAGRIITPRAATVGELALYQRDFVSGDKLEPIYLREITFVKAPLPRIMTQ